MIQSFPVRLNEYSGIFESILHRLSREKVHAVPFPIVFKALKIHIRILHGK